MLMRNARLWMVGLGGVAMAFAFALGTSQAQPGSATTARTTMQQADQVGAGVFATNCAVCHGTKASGKMGPPLNMLPPQVAALPLDQRVQQLTGLLRHGIPGAMPMFTPEQVSDEQVMQLEVYLDSLNNTLPQPSLYQALAPVEAAQVAGRTYFSASKHSVGGEFLAFWNRYGGIQVFGLPLSEEYNGISPENGNTYKMQLFERARLEYHPNRPAGQRIQLALVGAEELRLRTHFLQERR